MPRLSHLLCAALGAAVTYAVLTYEKKAPGPAADAAARAEALERRRVRAGQPVVEPAGEGTEGAVV